MSYDHRDDMRGKRMQEPAITEEIIAAHGFTPEEFATQLPTHTGVWVLRNPLRRLASIHARGWTSIVRPNHDFDFFREYAERWLDRPAGQRVVFEDLRRDPNVYFTTVLNALGLPADRATVDRAVAYQQREYHGRSGEREPEHDTTRSISEASRDVPREAVELYLTDPFMRNLFRTVGWSLRSSRYLPSRRHRLMARVDSWRSGDKA